MLRVLGYLKGYLKYGIIIGIKERNVNEADEVMDNWDEQYPGAREELPDNMPIPKGMEVNSRSMWMHNHVTRRSLTGVLWFISNTLIKWYLKIQRMIESSTYGAELVALGPYLTAKLMSSEF